MSVLIPNDIRCIAEAKHKSANDALKYFQDLMQERRMSFGTVHASSAGETRARIQAEPLIPVALLQSSPPKQSVGNCGYASIEGALIAAVAHLKIKDCLSARLLPGHDLLNRAKTKYLMAPILLHLKLSKLEEYLKKNQGNIDRYLVEQFCKNMIPEVLGLSHYPEVEKFLSQRLEKRAEKVENRV